MLPFLATRPSVPPSPTQIRRSLLEVLSQFAFDAVSSFHSDSAVSFALFLHHLPDVRSAQPPEVLLRAMQVGLSPAAH
jgi:hypothetical protein